MKPNLRIPRSMLAGLAILSLMIFAKVPVYGQDYEDDFEETIEEKKETKEETKIIKEIKKEKKDEVKSDTEKKKSEYTDDFEEENTVVDEETQKIEKEAELKKQKEKEELLKKQAEAEARIKEQKAKEEQRRLLDEQKKKEQFSNQFQYRDYFTNKLTAEKIKSRMPTRHAFAWGINLGYHPNLGNSAEEGFTFGDHFKYVDNFESYPTAEFYLTSKKNKGLSQIGNGYQAFVSDLRSSILKDDNESEADYIKRLENKAKTYTSSAALDSFPLGLNLTHYGSFFITRLGVNFNWTLLGLGGTNRIEICSGPNNYCDLADTAENASLKANDVHLYFENNASMMRLDLPLSFALRVLSSRAFGAYIGGGFNLFWGRNVSETTTDLIAGSDTPVKEKDVYHAWGLGYHFLLGVEAEISENLYLSVEIFQNFGQSNLTEDTDLDDNEVGIIQEKIQLNFSGTQILVGIRRFL